MNSDGSWSSASGVPGIPETTSSYQYNAEGVWTPLPGYLPTDEQSADLELTGLTNGGPSSASMFELPTPMRNLHR